MRSGAVVFIEFFIAFFAAIVIAYAMNAQEIVGGLIWFAKFFGL